MSLRMIDTFSGIGGFSLAARWLGGIETVQFVEREPYCQRIIRKHWPTVPIHDDICTYEPEPRSADIICGGFPCQDISTAGKQAGIKEGTRSGLFYELMRVIRLVGPQYIVLENVAAITHRGLDIVLGELAEAGYDAEWACIPASAVGACHRRDRWWCVAYPQGERRGEGPRQGASQDGREVQGTGHGGAGSASYAYDDQPQARQPLDQFKRQANASAGNGAAPDSMRKRLERPHELESSRSQWPAASFRLSPDWRGYLSEPVLRRGDDGLSGRVDRLKALGNAVVPQVAMVPLARVLQLTAAL